MILTCSHYDCDCAAVSCLAAIPCDPSWVTVPPLTRFRSSATNASSPGLVAVGNIFSIECLPGYTQTDNAVTDHARCDLGPRWTLLAYKRCDPVVCGPLPTVAHSRYLVYSFNFESVARYHCEESYNRTAGSETLQCGADGQWHGAHIVCKSTGSDSTDASSSGLSHLKASTVIVVGIIACIMAVVCILFFLTYRHKEMLSRQLMAR